MRISVNLATRPFVELRPFFLRLRLLMAGLAVLGVLLAVGAQIVSSKAEKQQIELDRLRNLTIATQDAKLRTEQRMRQPANAEVLDRAHFLNTLFLRKSFSWTAVMMDLEDVLPAGVQVTSIEPAVTSDGAVVIRLRVAGERDRAVQLVRNLERSRRFLQPRLGSESAQTKEATTGANGARGAGGFGSPGGFGGSGAPAGVPTGPPAVEFEILANYNPLPGDEPYKESRPRPVAANGRPGFAPRAAAVEPVTASQEMPAVEASTAPAVRERAVAPAVNPEPGASRFGNGRRGYPADGVVLPPYGGPPRPQDGRLPSGASRAPGGGNL